MRHITLIDTTLLQAYDLRKSALSFKEKLEIANCLDRLRADVIELPPITGQKADELFGKTVAASVKSAVSACVPVNSALVNETWESVKAAKKPILNVTAPASPVQMEYTGHMKAPAMLEAIKKQVAACRALCADVEFTALDATRAEPEFLYAAVTAAVEAGASRVTLCDSAGVLLPDEFITFLNGVRENAPKTADAKLFVQVSDGMCMAAACAAAAVEAGADGVKCTAVPAGYTTLEQIARLAQVKGSALEIEIGLRTTELNRVVSQISRIVSANRSEPKPFDHSGGEIANICLDKNDDITEVTKVVSQLGYDLSEEDNAKVYEAFRRIAVKKQFVGTRELDAIVASTALQVPATFRIDSYVINSGNVLTATANITVLKDGERRQAVAVGDGPIDAAFFAIEQIVGHHYDMDDFQIQTVTEGAESMGSAMVKLRADGKVYAGSGISTDIIGAAIRAYISALNKIVYEGE